MVSPACLRLSDKSGHHPGKSGSRFPSQVARKSPHERMRSAAHPRWLGALQGGDFIENKRWTPNASTPWAP